jgi:hypothetical protein
MTKLLGAFSILFMIVCCAPGSLIAQNLLDKRISIEVTNKPLSDVLKLISNQGNFYFSYNSSIIKRDSLVSISASNKSVQQVLDQLFHNRYSWKQYNNYIILRKAVVKPDIVAQSASADKVYTVSGYVLNGETGEKISNATIYEKQRLASTLSDEKGFFKIRLKSRYNTATLTISREFFEDTTVEVKSRYNQQLTIVMVPAAPNEPVVTISPVDIFKPDTIVVKPPLDSLTTLAVPAVEEENRVEKTRFGKFLLNTQQNIQSLNLKKFFANRTVQMSILPWIGTHGRLSGQVINHFSANFIGGYSAGVNGLEIGGAFNIDKKDVRYVQGAGFLNVVGGSVTGLQAAGFHNNVLSDMNGVQGSGFSNFVKGNVTGLQASGTHNHVGGHFRGIQGAGFSNYTKKHFKGLQATGFYNHVSDSMTGMQAAGFANYARKQVTGVQAAGFGNFANREMTGAQLAPVFNYAKKMKGVQIGLINVADSSSGYSIGLINIVFKGYHKLAFYTSEVMEANAAFKTGNNKLYSILLMGANSGRNDSSKLFGFGYGVGHEFSLNKRFSINPEYTLQYLYLGSWNYANLLYKIHLQFNYKLSKWFTVFAGPSFTWYYSDQPSKEPGYRFNIPSPNYHKFDLWGDNVKGWIGWNAGIAIF